MANFGYQHFHERYNRTSFILDGDDTLTTPQSLVYYSYDPYTAASSNFALISGTRNTVNITGILETPGTVFHVQGSRNTIVSSAIIDNAKAGLIIEGSDNSITDSGVLTGKEIGVSIKGEYNNLDLNIVNGRFLYTSPVGIDVQGGHNSITVRNYVDSLNSAVAFSGSYADLTNYGVLKARVSLTDGVISLKPYAHDITIDNHGFILALNNQMAIHQDDRYTVPPEDDDPGVLINNFNEISGIVQLGSGDDTINDHGIIKSYQSSLDPNAVLIDLGNGNDEYIQFAGSLTSNNPIAGGGGHDILSGHNAENVFLGGAGFDRLWGRGGDDWLSGGDYKDELDGGANDDTLIGGGGADTLDGGSGYDAFVFDVEFRSPVRGTSPEIDTLGDFTVGEDRIYLDPRFFPEIKTVLGHIFDKQVHNGIRATEEFHRIIYNPNSGTLIYDQDGSGTAYAPVRFAFLGTSPETLSGKDFVLMI